MRTYPVNSSELLKLDQKLIDYLKGRTAVASIASSARDSYYKITKNGYKFDATWSAADEFDITIAGQMEIDSKKQLTFLSYVFCVSREGYLLRKFHYDYEGGRGKNKPLFHLQYGGNPLPNLDGYGGNDFLISWLSEPRLFYTPMSLVLVLEQAFLEFPDDKTEKIRKDPNWKGHLLDAQRTVLAPYFNLCLKKINDNERLYAECYI